MNPFDLLKNMKDIQAQAGEMQAKLKDISAIGSAGGGMVVVEINGAFELLRINIEKDAVDPEDIKMLEDLIFSAFSQASSEIKAKMQQETMGMMPGIFPQG